MKIRNLMRPMDAIANVQLDFSIVAYRGAKVLSSTKMLHKLEASGRL